MSFGAAVVLFADRGEAYDGAHQIFFCGEWPHRDPGSFESLVQGSLTPLHGLVEAGPEAFIMGIHVQLLARLGIFNDDGADIGQLELARVGDVDGEHFVALVKQGQGALPSRRTDKIRNNEDQ